MSIIKYCGIVLAALVVLLIMGELNQKLSKIISICITGAMCVAALAMLFPSIKYIFDYAENSAFGKYIDVIIKALGVAFVSEICADICKDAGEAGIASKLEFIAKAELLLLIMPLVGELLSIAKNFAL